jgi:hypothetical protein
MRAYGTDDVFVSKTAGERPLASRVADLAWGQSLLSSNERSRQARQLAQAEMLNTAFRVLELARMEHAIDSAGHTPAPMILPAGFDMPVGMTEGMVRLASAAGEDMAKAAAEGPHRVQPPEGIVPEPDPTVQPQQEGVGVRVKEAELPYREAAPVAAAASPVKGFLARAGIDTMPKLKRTAIGLGGTALAVGGGLAALHKGLGWLSGQPHTPSYNQGGFQVSQDTNEFGQTQGRLPTYR